MKSNRIKQAIITLYSICIITGCGGRSSEKSIEAEPIDAEIEISTNQTSNIHFFLGQQLDDYNGFDSINGITPLSQLTSKWFRIHAGGDNGVLPEKTATDSSIPWDFSALDRLVQIAHESSTNPILNIRSAPASLATCSDFHSGSGSLKDSTFEEFANYVAAIVSYFNNGSYTEPNGTQHINPFGTSHRIEYWEIWNEPDLQYEFPCTRNDNRPALTEEEFATMWLITTQRMRTVDPTIKMIGPTVSDPRNLTYLRKLIQQNTPPDIISVHGYTGSIQATDYNLLKGGNGSIGADGITLAIKDIITELDKNNLTQTPIILDELNISPDGEDDPFSRGWNQFGISLTSNIYIKLASTSQSHPISIIPFQFVEYGGMRLSSINPTNGERMLPYWRDWLVSNKIRSTDQQINSHTPSENLPTLALRSEANDSIKIFIANSYVKSNGLNTSGQNKNITIKLDNWLTRTPTSIRLNLIDSTNQAQIQTLNIPISNTPPKFSFNGNGLAVLEINY